MPLGIWTDKNKEKCYDYESDDESSEQYPFLFLADKSEFLLCEKGETQMKARVGMFHSYIKEDRVNIYDYSQNTVLNITRINENCLRMEWTGTSSSNLPLRDCFVMKDQDFITDLEWFGAHELYTQTWPMNNININMTPFLPHDYLADTIFQSRETFGPALHPLWLVSNGAGILVDHKTPLHVSIHQDDKSGELCLQALPYSLECIPNSYELTELHYSICIHNTIAETAKYFLRQMPHPRDVPAKETFESPIWSTWAAFKTNISNDLVGDYIHEIKDHGFEISQVELDDGYGGTHGDLCMHLDAKELVKKFNVCLTAWVHPFVNSDSNRFDLVDDDVFLPGKNKIEWDSVSLVKWWHGYGAVINYLDEDVVEMQKTDLINFKDDYNLISFKFDAGEVTYLPKCVYIQNGENPGNFATEYANFVGNSLPKEVSSRAEVRVGYFSQANPIWVRLLDRSSNWGLDNGLHSVLTAALTFGIAGYPFILPDMIGGNGDFSDLNRSLFVRWMQLNTFLPAMQFSVPPFWFEDDDITGHALELVKIHKNLSDVMYALALEAVNTSYPIIRPLWWIDDSTESIRVNDQFLIGDDIMVAPILENTEDPVLRCVYFPSGSQWQWNGTVYPDDCDPEKKCEHRCPFLLKKFDFVYFTRVKD